MMAPTSNTESNSPKLPERQSTAGGVPLNNMESDRSHDMPEPSTGFIFLQGNLGIN